VGTGKTQLLLSNLDLRYEGPDYPKNSERIAIDQRGKEINPKSRLIDRASHPIHTSYIVNFLASLTDTEEPAMQALHQGMAIYQYVNIGAILLTSAVHTSIQAQSGEVVSWSIWRFNAPLPLVYAEAQIENTTISVGAIGPAADEIEDLLGRLTRLTPESAVLDQVELGARAWNEYLQHFYRTRFDQR
jgi:endonuclease IV